VRISRGIATASVALALGAPGSAEAVRITDRNAVESAVVVRINAVRSNHGLRPLAVAPRLRRAAEQHVRNMALHGYFSHSWSSGSSFGTWIERFWPGPGYTSWAAGENLFWSSPDATAAKIMRRWLRSPGHRANILRPEWKRLGLGVVHVREAVGTYRSARTATIAAAEFGYRAS
jgi:uncharacterized protein YkwD